jgi:DNA polymerase III gamma/tau subunit
MRDTMIVYRSFYEAIRELPKENQAEIWNAVYELGLNGNEVELTGLSKTIFMLVKPQIEANLKRFENGKKPKLKQNKSKTEAKDDQDKIKSEANNNNNNNNNLNNNKNLEDRKNDFAALLQPYIETYGREMLNEFYMYWTEHNQRKTKLKYEMQSTWSLERRLNTWSKQSVKFGTAVSKAEKPKFDPYG